MPKPTFMNLAPAKRQLIIDRALEEFADNPYGLASISRIVARADIAKGSLYQYFANKQDLYLFLLAYAAQTQLELLQAQAPPDPAWDCFTLLRWQMSASLRVGLATPLLTRLMYRAVTDDLPFRDQVTQQLQSAGEAHLQQLLERGVARGEVDPTRDLDLAAFLIRSLLGDLRLLIIRRLDLPLDRAVDDLNVLHNPDVERIYDQVIRMLQHGLALSHQSTAEQEATA